MVLENFEAAMTARWLQAGIGPREAAAKLQPAFNGIELDEQAIQALDNKWEGQPDALGIVYALLDGWHRLAGFGCKTSQSPVDHAEIILMMAEISKDKFPIDDIRQTIESDEELRVSLVSRGERYSFSVQDHGRRYNIDGVLDGLNAILSGLDLAERFIEFYSGSGSVAILTFARKDQFLSVAKELGIRLER